MDLIFGSSSRVIAASSPADVLEALLKAAPFNKQTPLAASKRRELLKEIEYTL